MQILDSNSVDIILPAGGEIVKVEIKDNEKLTILNDEEGKVYYNFSENIDRKWIPLPPLGAVKVDRVVYFRNFTKQIIVLATDRI